MIAETDAEAGGSTPARGGNVREAVLAVLEALIAAGVVFGIAWGLARWAEAVASRPFEPDRDGTVVLPAGRARTSGGLELEPTEKEMQGPPFDYHFGRELDAERRNRWIAGWESGEDAAGWSIRLERPARAEVELDLEAGATAVEWTVGIGDLTGIGAADPADRDDRRVVVPVAGIDDLPAGEHEVNVRPVDPAAASGWRLHRVVVRLVREPQD